MSFKEPGAIETALTNVLTYTFSASSSRRYVQSLDLSGIKGVLDYGSGNGAVSRFLAERLREEGGHLTCLDISAEWQRIIRKKLTAYSNVDFFQGTIGDFAAAREGGPLYDAGFIHFMLHDIPKEERQGNLITLSGLLRSGGKLFVKEPVKESHGIPPEEIRGLCSAAGLAETEGRVKKNIYEGVFIKK
jgi:SAM-dependent methyltransferase